jgi:elongation factor Ts
MADNVEQLKALRQATGARMLDCQKALKECGGNMDEAMAWLRKKNLAAGEATSARQAQEGLLGVKMGADGRAMAIVEVSSNTDFVARNDKFKTLVGQLADLCEGLKIDSVEVLQRQRLNGRGVSEILQELAGTMGENIAIKRVAFIEGELGSYVHFDQKQAAVVELEGVTGEKAKELGKELAMHVVFAKPTCIMPAEVPAADVEKEKAIIQERLKEDPKNSNKPPQILEKIAEGQLGKFYAAVCLNEQPYFRENAKKISQILKESGGAKVKRFIYMKVGG